MQIVSQMAKYKLGMIYIEFLPRELTKINFKSEKA